MLIGLHGRKSSGKDTVCAFLLEWAKSEGRPARRDAFADRLKLSAIRALGYHGDDADCLAKAEDLKQPGWEVVVREPSGIEHFITGRQYIQYDGDEGHRQVFGEDFWIPFVLDSYLQAEILVVADVRYPNEADAIRALGGEIWHVLRVGLVSLDAHVSEEPLPPNLINHLLINDRDLNHLQQVAYFHADRLAHSHGTTH